MKDIEQLYKNQKSITSIYSFVQPTYIHPRLDTTKFNYNGECREPFKYKRNNKRDLVFHSYHFKDEESWNQLKQRFIDAFEINKSGIPNARKIFMTYGDWANDEFKEVVKDAGYEIIKSDIPLKKGEFLNVAVYRFFDFEKYLLKHKDEFDRVVISDVMDVYWFADGFQTIGDDELIVIPECDDFDKDNNKWCRVIGDSLSGYNGYWVKDCFGDDVLNQLEKDKAIVINSGFVAGSTEKVLKFLRIFNQFMMKKIEKLNTWGFDQSAMTVAHHFGLFNELNITLEKNTRRMGNDMRGRYKYDKDEKVLYMLSKKCSPIIRHKIEDIDG